MSCLDARRTIIGQLEVETTSSSNLSQTILLFLPVCSGLNKPKFQNMLKFLQYSVCLRFTLLSHLFFWGGATNIKVIDTFGDGSLSYGVTQKRDFATISEDPVSSLPAEITICSSLTAETGPAALAFFQLLDDNGSSSPPSLLLNFLIFKNCQVRGSKLTEESMTNCLMLR